MYHNKGYHADLDKQLCDLLVLSLIERSHAVKEFEEIDETERALKKVRFLFDNNNFLLFFCATIES